MTVTYGLTADGFVAKPLTVIREDLNTLLRNAFGASIELHDKSAFGQVVGILAEREALLWQLAQAVYSAQDRDAATGAALDALCALTGTTRPPASYSVTPVVLTGTPGTPVTATSAVKTSSTEKEFTIDEDKTIAAVPAWAATTAYLEGARVTSNSYVFQCVTSGSSGSVALDIPDPTSTVISDGSAEWVYLGEGTGAVDADATATETGPTVALARDLTVIVNAIPGWDSVVNLNNAQLGRNRATDAELRELAEAELSQAGTSTLDAIRAALLEVPTVVAVTMFENVFDEDDADGMPPHSVEALVRGPDSPTSSFRQAIYDCLFANVAAGIRTHGNQTGTAIDSQGTSHTIKYSEPIATPIYVNLKVRYDASRFPADGATQIKTAIVDFGDAQDTGKDAIVSAILAQAFQVTGVTGVEYIGIATSAIATPTTWAASTTYSSGNVVINRGRMYRCTTSGTSAASGGPTSTGTGISDNTAVWEHLGEDIAIAARELATFNALNITVTTTSVTP